MNFNIHLIFFIINNLIIISCYPTVPVLVLSNLNFYVQCPALEHQSDEFITEILLPITNLYILVEKKLSPEDFSASGQRFFPVNADEINYCAAVTNELVPYITLEYGEKNKLNFTANNSESIQKFIHDSTKNVFPSVYYVYFQDEGEFNARSDMISAHNIFVAKIYEILSIFSKSFLLVYTALEPSWVFNTGNIIRQKREDNNANITNSTGIEDIGSSSTETTPFSTTENTSISSALSADNSTTTSTTTSTTISSTNSTTNLTTDSKNKTNLLAANPGFLIYIKEAILLRVHPPSFNKTNNLVMNNCSLESNVSDQMKIKCDTRTISLNFTTSKDPWAITSISIPNQMFIESLNYSDLIFTMRNVRAPFGYAFHCSEIKLSEIIPKSTRNVILTIRGLQVQFFDEANKGQRNFSESYDCFGWTSIPILSGLFVSFTLLSILGIGVVMLLDIRTNDRYDDPKKKRAMSFLMNN